MKKLVVGLFVSVLFAGLVACSSNDGEREQDQGDANSLAVSNLTDSALPIVKEEITVDVLFPRDPLHGDFDKMWFMDELQKRTNIYLNYQPVERAGWEERKKLAFATNDLPEIFLAGITSQDENLYGPQGMLIDLAPLIEKYAPNAKALLEKYPEVKKTFTNQNGAMYALPAFNDYRKDTVGNRIFINRQWLDNLGLDVPDTLDELYTALKAFKEQDPNGNGEADEIPLSGLFDGSTRLSILTALGFVDPRHDVIDGSYVYVPIDSGYKEYLTYMNKLYSEGLLDKDYFTQTPEQLVAKVGSMQVGMDGDGNVVSNVQGDDLYNYQILQPMTSAIHSDKIFRKMFNYTRGWGTLAITRAAKNPEAVMRLVDYFLTLEGTIMLRMGPEKGKWDGEGGFELQEVDGKKTAVIDYANHNSSFNFRMANGPMNAPFYNSDEYGVIVDYSYERGAWVADQLIHISDTNIGRHPYPEVTFSPEEQEQIAAYLDMDNYADQMEAKFIMGITPLSEWDNYVDTFKKMGVAQMIELRQKAYERWNSL